MDSKDQVWYIISLAPQYFIETLQRSSAEGCHKFTSMQCTLETFLNGQVVYHRENDNDTIH